MRKLKLLALLFFFSLGVKPAVHALTRSEIRDRVRVLIKDTNSSRYRFTDTQLNSFINECQRDIVNNTWVITKSTDITLVNGTTYYSIPTDLLAMQRVTLDSRNLTEVTLIKLDGDNGDSNWASSGGRPINYFQDPAQSDKIGMYPWPNSSSSTGTLHIIYTAELADISSDSSVFLNAENRYLAYHDLPIYFSAYRVYFVEGESDKATLYRQEYESRLQVMVQAIGKKPNYVPGMSGSGKGR